MIIAVARNRFDLRLEGHIFQPYEPFITNADGTVGTAAAFSKRYYLGSYFYSPKPGWIFYLVQPQLFRWQHKAMGLEH